MAALPDCRAAVLVACTGERTQPASRTHHGKSLFKTDLMLKNGFIFKKNRSLVAQVAMGLVRQTVLYTHPSEVWHQ